MKRQSVFAFVALFTTVGAMPFAQAQKLSAQLSTKTGARDCRICSGRCCRPADTHRRRKAERTVANECRGRQPARRGRQHRGELSLPRRRPDGYTMLTCNFATHGLNPAVYRKLPVRSAEGFYGRRDDRHGAEHTRRTPAQLPARSWSAN